MTQKREVGIFQTKVKIWKMIQDRSWTVDTFVRSKKTSFEFSIVLNYNGFAIETHVVI